MDIAIDIAIAIACGGQDGFLGTGNSVSLTAMEDGLTGYAGAAVGVVHLIHARGGEAGKGIGDTVRDDDDVRGGDAVREVPPQGVAVRVRAIGLDPLRPVVRGW